MTMTSFCDDVIRYGLVGLIAFTPLAFGTVEPWSIALMEWGIVTLSLVFWLDRLWPRHETVRRVERSTGVGRPLAAFMLLCALQTVPLPLTWVRVVSPGTMRLGQAPDFRALLRDEQPTGAVPGADPALLDLAPVDRRAISVAPEKTWERLRLLGALVLLFYLAAGWADRGERVLFLLRTITVVGFLVAIEGLVQSLAWNGRIYWFRNVPPSSPFGPFVNHNHFAGYVEMVIPVAIGLTFLLTGSRQTLPRTASAPQDPGPLAAASGTFRREDGRWGKGGLALFACVILVATLILSLSRGGILSTLASGMILFGFLVKRTASRRLAIGIGIALPLLALGLILWVGAQAVGEQIESYKTIEHEASFRSRVQAWKGIVQGMPEFLWVGSGLGAFEESYRPWAPLGSAKRWDRAHNDYLQLLWETGLVGGGLFVAGLARFLRRYWWPAFKGRGHPLNLLRVGIAVSLLSIALHSLVDFNLQIGANGFLCALLAALLVSLQRIIDADRREKPVLVPVGGERPGARAVTSDPAASIRAPGAGPAHR